jgi:hypothetical protein
MPSKPSYTIGYGRPPKQSRFRPGKSGNPKGRPRGTRNLSSILAQVLAEKAVVIENGRPRATTMGEIIIAGLVERAARSDRAVQLILAMQQLNPHDGSQARELIRLTDADKQVLEFIRKSRLDRE